MLNCRSMLERVRSAGPEPQREQMEKPASSPLASVLPEPDTSAMAVAPSEQHRSELRLHILFHSLPDLPNIRRYE